MIPYWKKGCRYLLKNDPVFKKYYNPDHYLKLNHNKFDVRFKSICSQQISVSAAMSIYKKTKKIIGNVNFKNFKDKADMVNDLPITLNKKNTFNKSNIPDKNVIASLMFGRLENKGIKPPAIRGINKSKSNANSLVNSMLTSTSEQYRCRNL